MRFNFFLPSSLVIVTALLAPARAGAATHVGDIEVREGNSTVPCFTVSEQEEKRWGTPNFRAIVVSDGPDVMWKMSLPTSRTFSVSYHMCIPYAGRLPVLPQTPAAPLRPGRMYDVIIRADAQKTTSAPRLYKGKFCVAGQEGQWQLIEDSKQCKSVR
jgi:hypothetical protein